MNLWKKTHEVFREIKRQGLMPEKISGSGNLYYIYDILPNGSVKKPLALLSFDGDTASIDLLDRKKESKLGARLQEYYPPKREEFNREYIEAQP